MKLAFVLVMSFFLLICGCTSKVDLEAEKASVQAVLNNMEKAFETNDAELLASLFSKSPNNVFFGTDAAERWVGFDNFMDAQKQFFKAVDTGSNLTFNNVVVNVSSLGDAAWISCVMDWEGVALGEPFKVNGGRFTLVLQKQESDWLICQTHGSIPVSGQVVEY